MSKPCLDYNVEASVPKSRYLVFRNNIKVDAMTQVRFISCLYIMLLLLHLLISNLNHFGATLAELIFTPS